MQEQDTDNDDQAPILSSKSFIDTLEDLARKSRFREIESQRGLSDVWMLDHINNCLLDPETTIKIDASIEAAAGTFSRPISVYFDTEDLRLRESGITLRFRYGSFGYQPQTGVKIDIDKFLTSAVQREFRDAANNITNRIELEENSSFSTFSPTLKTFFDVADIEDIDQRHLTEYVGNITRRKPLVPIFVTDSPRNIFLFHTLTPEGQDICFELALDHCSYYALDPRSKVFVPTNSNERNAIPILTDQFDIATTEINGYKIGTYPQYELELKHEMSGSDIPTKHILEAEQRCSNIIAHLVGPKNIYSKASKGTMGYKFLSKHLSNQ